MKPIKPVAGRTLQGQVIDAILDQIQSGKLTVGDPLVPERQLCADLGVSRITVVRALDRLEADGWVSRQQGRGTFISEPPTKPMGPTIALMAAVPAHPSLFRSLIGMCEVINAADGQLRLLGSFEGLGSERDMVDRALRDGAEGLIVYPDSGTLAPEIYRELVDRRVPLVLIDRYFPDLPTNRVIYDDEAAGAELCGRLFDEGVEKIAIMSHREFDVTSVQNRIAGAYRAAKTRGRAADAVEVWPEVYADFSPSQATRGSVGQHLDRLQTRLNITKVDAFFAINGDVAERLSRDLETLQTQSNSKKCFRFCACVHQPITGPSNTQILFALENAEELGRQAAMLVAQKIKHRDEQNSSTIRIKMRIE